jgi:hypothetical protein
MGAPRAIRIGFGSRGDGARARAARARATSAHAWLHGAANGRIGIYRHARARQSERTQSPMLQSALDRAVRIRLALLIHAPPPSPSPHADLLGDTQTGTGVGCCGRVAARHRPVSPTRRARSATRGRTAQRRRRPCPPPVWPCTGSTACARARHFRPAAGRARSACGRWSRAR